MGREPPGKRQQHSGRCEKKTDVTVGQSPKEKSWAGGPSELRLPVVALSCTQPGIAGLADRPETEIAEYPDLVTGSQAQPEPTIGLGRSNHLSAAGELFSHKGSATEDTSIGEIADTGTQKLRERNLALLFLKNFLGTLHVNDCSGFGSGRSGL